MTYIAELQIKVDSSQVESATQKLKELTQATSSSAQAEGSSRKVRQDSANKTVAAEQKASKAEQQRLDQWFALSARRDKEEATQVSRREAIMARDVKESAQSLARQQKADALASAAEQKRYDQWLKNADKQAQAEEKQLSAVETARAKQAKQALDQQTKSAQAISAAEIKAKKDLDAEQERLDKARYQRTLKRFDEEDKLATKSANTKAKSVGVIDDETKAMNRLLASIDPVTRELQRLNVLEADLKKLNANGTINTDQYVRYQRVIDDAREKTAKYNTELGRTGITAKQVRQAQMGLPAQFTDIIVSLQGGQAPLTVLLQQGGQIKDMFGGFGNAVKGVAGALAAMINPVTFVAAAFVPMVALWYDGGNQLQKLNGALAQTGSFSGQTADQLFKLAEAHGQNISSVRENIEALSQLVKSGKLLPQTYGAVSEAATSMASVSGQALDSIISDFNSLGDEPVKAAIKLNEKYHFLTDAVYQNAQALVSQGKEQDAIILLTNTLASTVADRAKDMEESGRGVAKVWNGVKNAISNAITEAGKGLNPTLGTELEGIQNRLQLFRDNFKGRPEVYEKNPEYVMLLGQELELKEKIALKDKEAATTRANQLKQEAAIAARASSLKKEQDAWDGVRKAKEELKKFDLGLKPAGDVLSEEDTKKLRQPYLDAIKKAEEAESKKAESKVPKSAIIDDTDVNDLQNKVAEIKATYAALTESVKEQQVAGTLSVEAGFEKRQSLLAEEAAKTKAAYQGQIAALEALKDSKNISANQSISLDRKIADARSKMVVAEENAQKDLKKSAALEEERVKTQTRNIDNYNKSLQQMIDNLRVAGERDRAGLSMGNGRRELSGKLNSEDDRYADEVKDLNNQAAENPQLAGEVSKKLDAAAIAHTRMKDQIVSNYDQMKAAQMDWGAGVKSAFEQYIEDGQNYAGLTNQAFTSAFSSMEDSIVGFVTTGKLSFADLTKSILADMARIATKAAASSALSAILGAFGGGTTSAGSTTAGYDNLAGWTGPSQAKGGGWTGGKQFFAKGGAFTNTVVSKPTAFAHAGGIGEMGEKGPEAIMPLTRASDGSLGVRAQVDLTGLQQQAGGGGVLVNITINGETGQTQTESSDGNYQQFAKEIGGIVEQKYRTLMNKDLAPGGDIWKQTNGRG